MAATLAACPGLGCGGDITNGAMGCASAGCGADPPVEGHALDPAGARPVDESCFDGGVAAACAVSFSRDIFPKMKSTGAWRCASGGCHGGGPTKPAMSDDPGSTYASLVEYTLLGSTTRYVQPCDPDVTVSAITCNLGRNASCGSFMPLLLPDSGVTEVSDDDLARIETWVRCGAPNN